MTGTLITKYNASLRMLQSATSIVEVKAVRDLTNVMRELAKVAQDREAERLCDELRLRATRKIGEMIAEQRRTHGLAKGAARPGVGRRGKRGSGENPHHEITFRDMEISKAVADQARKLARLSETEFTELVKARRDISKPAGKRTVDSLTREAGIKRRNEAVAARIANQDQRTRTDILVEEEGPVPLEFGSYREKYEWLLRTNPSSPNLPETINSVSKIVADALWRFDRMGVNVADAHYSYKISRIFDLMWERLDKLEKEMVKARNVA
jgi:hypothetical protein